MIEWEEFSLRDLISVNPRLKLTKNEVARKIGMEHLIPNQKWPIDFEMTSFKGGSKFQNEDVLLARITPCLENGKTGMVRGLNHGEVAFGSTEFLVLRSDGPIDQTFLFYLAIEPNFREYAIQTMTGSSGRQRVQTDALLDFTLDLPSLEEQEAIAEVLSSLDDKIDLLKRQNKTLEGMAEALFRQWFIEEAQDDWEHLNASDFVEHLKVSEKPQAHPDKWYHHFSLPSFDDGMNPRKEKGEDIKSNKYVVHANSILISKLNPGTPRIWHCGSNIPVNPVCSTEFQVVRPNVEVVGFFKCLYSSYAVTEFLGACASGTSGSHQRVKPQDIVELEFRAPSFESMVEFSKTTEAWLDKVIENREQILTLEKERDTLLPKLMSGEVRVQMH